MKKMSYDEALILAGEKAEQAAERVAKRNIEDIQEDGELKKYGDETTCSDESFSYELYRDNLLEAWKKVGLIVGGHSTKDNSTKDNRISALRA